tara:strand:- start:6 stop:143 length:138 start_codon:yes stop_codon:yes gene_type:complete
MGGNVVGQVKGRPSRGGEQASKNSITEKFFLEFFLYIARWDTFVG